MIPTPTRWEYRTEAVFRGVPLSNEQLNALGAKGWELVAFTRSADAIAVFHYVFKRPVA
jgi:hypothetical protein